MKTITKLILFFLFIILISGCATIFKGSTEDINFSSEPAQAKVYVNGSLLGKTPLQLELKSKHDYVIEFKKDGYESKTVLLNGSVGGGWIVLDILGGLVPIVIDAATGNWNSLDQDHVNAVLEMNQKPIGIK